MKIPLILFAFLTSSVVILSSCCDDNTPEPQGYNVIFYEDKLTAEWTEVFVGLKTKEYGQIESLTKNGSTEYIVKGNVVIEGTHYNLEAIFNPFSDKITIYINGEEFPNSGTLIINECHKCTAGLSVFIATNYHINPLNYISFTIQFLTDFLTNPT